MTDQWDEAARELALLFERNGANFQSKNDRAVAAALRSAYALGKSDGAKAGQEDMRERAARECCFPINRQHPLKPIGVAMSTSPASPVHADAIRNLPIKK